MQKYQNNIAARNGDSVVGAKVLIKIAGTATPATIYSDDGVTITPNPLTTDGNGYFEFYVANGLYDIAVSGKNTYTDVLIADALGIDADALKKAEAAAPSGTTLIGSQRTAIADVVSSQLASQISALEFSVWEFISSVVKPNPADPSTWDWTTAFQVAQAALIVLGGGTLKLPRGTVYYVSGNGIQTATSNSYYNLSPTIRFVGEGPGTVISRREDQATDVVDRATPSTFHNSAFNIHTGNVCVENLAFENCKSAFYLGQKHGEVDTCSVAFCKFKNIWVRNCGMWLHMRSGIGNHYNTFEDIHVWQCQIMAYIDKHPTSAESNPNNNRNQFRMVRSSRCYVGPWVAMGDTNQFFGQHNEGNTATPTNNRYAAPTGLPFGETGGIGQLIGVGATNNLFSGCMQEANGKDLVNGGIRNSYSGLYNDEVAGKVRHIEKPYFYSTRTMSVTDGGNTFWFTNAQGDVFASYDPGRVHHVASVELHSPLWQTTGTAFARSTVVDVGAVASAATFDITLWGENDAPFPASKSARFSVEIDGNSQTNSLAISTSFTVIALRNVSRTLTRYYVYGNVTGRATGAGTGDGTEPFVPSLSAGGAGSKDLILTVTAPARTFESVRADIRQSVG